MARLLMPNTLEIAESNWIETIWQQPVQRGFWIYNVPAMNTRGGHRHHSCQMVLHCVTGSVNIYVQTPAIDQYFTLNSPDQYLFVDPHDWRLMHRFSPDAILTVFASKPFETTIYYEQAYRPFDSHQLETGNADPLIRPDTTVG